jgi:MFS family permease
MQIKEQPLQQSTPLDGPAQSFPSRYFYGYVVVATCFAIQVIGWGIHNSYGIFFTPLVQEFGWTRASVAGAASMSVLVHGIGAIFLGGLNDRVGPRLIMTGCGLFMGSGYMLMSGLDRLWEIYLFYGLIIGMGVSGTDVVLLSTAARWFYAMRGIMSGIIKVGTGLGMVIAPLFIALIMKAFPWRICFFILGAIVLISYVLLAQLLVRDPALKKQYPDNARPVESVGKREPERGIPFRDALKTRQFWCICLISLLVVSCTYTILMHIVPHVIDVGIPPSKAATVLATLGGVSMAGRLVMGATADRIGTKMALMISISLILTGMCYLPWASTLWMFYVFAVFQGLGHGGFYALISPTVAEFFGTRSHGVLFGTVIFSTTIGGALGPFLAGYLFDVTNTYRVVFLTLAGTSLAALLLTATLTPTTHQKGTAQKEKS